MIDKETIEDLLIKKKIPKMDFYRKIGMTSKGFTQMFENDSMKVSTLLKIAEVLEVPVTTFFSVGTSTSNNVIANKDQTIAWQNKLMDCMEKKEALYEKLVLSESEKVQILKEYSDGIKEVRAKRPASSK